MTNYETVTLKADADEARETVLSSVAGLVASESEDGIKFRTNRGIQIAVLQSTDGGSTLSYRADPSLSPRGDATRKARHVHDAVAHLSE